MNRMIWPLAALMLVLIACKNPHDHSTSDPMPADAPAQTSDLTLEELIARHEQARGGKEKLQAIQSVTMTGKWETKKIEPSPITLTIAPERFLRRIEASNGLMIKAVSGTNTWEVTPQSGIKEPTPMVAKEAGRFRRLADPQGPLVNTAAKDNKIEVIGKLPWRDRQVYKLKVTFPDGGVNHVYLDAQSFLPVRVLMSMYSQPFDTDVEIEFLYSDYRDVEGVKWPFREEANAPEIEFSQKINWEKIEVNKPYDPAAFEMPKT